MDVGTRIGGLPGREKGKGSLLADPGTLAPLAVLSGSVPPFRVGGWVFKKVSSERENKGLWGENTVCKQWQLTGTDAARRG